MTSTRRIAMKIEYKGGKFRGSQLQLGVRTVQEEIEKAVSAFFHTGSARGIKATFCGRTDTGVHALGQVVHFDLPDEFLLRAFPNLSSENDSSKISENQQSHSNEETVRQLDKSILRSICWALNGILPDDVSVSMAQVVPNKFNARHSAIRRTYVYRILNRPQRSALLHKAQYLVRTPLDCDSMNRAAECLLGRHDFIGFKTSNKEKATTICLVERAEIFNKGEAELEFWISANHFVYNMVRIIVGTLVEVGLNKRDPSALSEVLAGQDRHLAGPTAPPWGLCLYSVDYPAEFSLFQRD